MKIYKTQKDIEKDVKNGVLTVKEDVRFECSFVIDASIVVDGNIEAADINARNINAGDISACDIKARNINAGDINAWNIKAWDVNAEDVNACNINAEDINAWDVSYYACCFVYGSITCESIEAKRDVHHEPICLDGELKIIKDDSKKQELLDKADELVQKAEELRQKAEEV